MRLSSIKLTNFRCFGATATTVEFDKLVVLIGANGAGKSSVLLALSRMFGVGAESLLAEGEIEDEAIYWIKTPNQEVKDSDKHRVSGADRSLIQCIYVPAIREPSKQLRQVAGTIVNRLFKAVKWSDETKKALKAAATTMGEAFQKEKAVGEIQGAIAGTWKSLHEFPAFSEVSFRPVAGEINDVLKNLEVIFRPGEAGEEHSVDRLSDGLKSLFYLSLVSAVFQIEESIRSKAADDNLFEDDSLSLPILTIFGVEEIENHLSPHYLGRILRLLKTMAESPTAQVVLTSQSPSILKRIDPENVRHFRFDSKTHLPAVSRIRLPDDNKGEVYKYVKEAVLAYPELYFSSLVILGEGDSEEIVIPRVMRAHHSDMDSQFISVVPLGGRHVNHFWRLLSDLGIPHLTLLDLDR
jgi:putative ATP-dependent endonuclease of OLD family